MAKIMFTTELRSLAKEASEKGICSNEFKTIVLNCSGTSKQFKRTDSHGVLLQSGDGDINDTADDSMKLRETGTFGCALKFIKRKATLVNIAILIVVFGIAAETMNSVVESEFNWRNIMETFQREECLISSNDIITEITRPKNNCSRCKDLKYVREVATISREEFMEKYAYTDVPLLVKGAAKDWSALRVFNYDYLKKLYTETQGAFKAVEDNCQFFSYKTYFLDLKDVFNMSDAKANLQDGEESWYIGWCDTNSESERELKKHYNRPEYLPQIRDDGEDLDIDWLFMGWPGEGAFVHIDMVNSPSWQAQLRGTKTWMFYPSVECEDVCVPMNVTLEAGDILTADTNKWFHATFIHPGNMSISIGAEY